MFLDLGMQPPADRFITKAQLEEHEPHFPLRVLLCEECGLVQLDTVAPADLLYCHDYPYESSITTMGRLHWQEFAATVNAAIGLGEKDLVVDIGSNVGVLLEMFAGHKARVFGVDPAANIAAIANARGIETMPSFFTMDAVETILKTKGPARVITGTNVFAHVDRLDLFMQAIDRLLAKDGLFIIEAPYLVNLIERLEYDTIYHEHLSYISIKPLKLFFESLGMEIADVQQRDIHGGSIRVWVQRKGTGPLKSTGAAEQLIQLEQYKGIYDLNRLHRFAADVDANRRELVWLIKDLKKNGKRVVAVSAPAKGMTLLNYCRFGRNELDYVTEKSTLKIGRFTPGGHIPVLPDAALSENPPDYALLLAWNFADEIINNLKSYSATGGRFIIPLPTPQIVE